MDVVLLDFDGTITKRDTTKVLVFVLLRSRPWRVFWVLGSLCRLAVGGNEARIQRAKDCCVGELLKGLSVEQVQPSLNRYRENVLTLIRPELASVIHEQSSAGRQVLVVTASAEIAVKEVLRDFAVTVLGTRFEILGGAFSGSLEGEGCYAAAKVPRIRAWADRQSTQPRFLEAWSDSLSDLSMMRLAEKRTWICSGKRVTLVRGCDPDAEIIQV